MAIDTAILDEFDAIFDDMNDRFDELTAKVERLEKEIEVLQAEVAQEVEPEVESDKSTDTSGELTPTADSEPTAGTNEADDYEANDYVATFYTAYCEGCSGITYSGHNVLNTIYTPEGLRIIAVDPTVIPLGTIVNVTLSDGTTFKAEASDIGGDIKGRRIDVLVASRDEAYKLGRQTVKVEILK